MPKHCLPPHLQEGPSSKHTDWIWPLSYIPRAWNAYCGNGPLWDVGDEYQSKPIPDPGYRSSHTWDQDGSYRPYWAVTYKNGLHVRHGYRWDDSPNDHYYNYVIFTAKVIS